jgi:hypothetical protein
LVIAHFAPICVCDVWANATTANTITNERKAIVRFMEISFTLKVQNIEPSGFFRNPVAASFA